MSDRNVETVKRIYELAAATWATGPGEVASTDPTELWDPEVVIEENAAFPDRATYRGYAGLARWWTAFFEIYDELRLEPLEFIVSGDRVVVPTHHRFVSKAGIELEREITHVWTLRDGRVVHATGYHVRSDALAAAGLA